MCSTQVTSKTHAGIKLTPGCGKNVKRMMSNPARDKILLCGKCAIPRGGTAFKFCYKRRAIGLSRAGCRQAGDSRPGGRGKTRPRRRNSVYNVVSYNYDLSMSVS